MIYIGKHPFVVGLIGAHTDKIKESKNWTPLLECETALEKWFFLTVGGCMVLLEIMYIVVEYCANGSLDKFLLKKKNRYVNQVEENDKINPNITQPVENLWVTEKLPHEKDNTKKLFSIIYAD